MEQYISKKLIKDFIQMGWNLRDWFHFHPEEQKKTRDHYLNELVDIAIEMAAKQNGGANHGCH